MNMVFAECFAREGRQNAPLFCVFVHAAPLRNEWPAAIGLILSVKKAHTIVC
jgi:hypothetical protein